MPRNYFERLFYTVSMSFIIFHNYTKLVKTIYKLARTDHNFHNKYSSLILSNLMKELKEKAAACMIVHK